MTREGSQSTLRRLVLTALLIAVEVVLHRFVSIKTPLVIIHMGFLPIALAGFACGPWHAAVAGGLSEFLGAVLFPVGAFFPGFSVTGFLTGLVFGLFFYGRPVKLLRVLTCSALISVLFTLLLDSYWLMVLYSKTDLLNDIPAMLRDEWFIPFASGRLLKAGVMLLAQTLLIYAMLNVLKRTELLKK